jgi:hypothetical protein
MEAAGRPEPLTTRKGSASWPRRNQVPAPCFKAVKHQHPTLEKCFFLGQGYGLLIFQPTVLYLLLPSFSSPVTLTVLFSPVSRLRGALSRHRSNICVPNGTHYTSNPTLLRARSSARCRSHLATLKRHALVCVRVSERAKMKKKRGLVSPQIYIVPAAPPTHASTHTPPTRHPPTPTHTFGQRVADLQAHR